nr:efflux pump atb [Quercus suber]
MFLTEPIVLVLSLLSGFSDALIFMFIQSYSLVYAQWDFNTWQVGLAFSAIGVGYIIGWALFIPAIRRNIKEREAKPNDERAQYESRLWFLLYTAPCLPIGLIGFAWTIQGPPLHWIGSMIFAAIVGIANYSICKSSYPEFVFQTVIDTPPRYGHDRLHDLCVRTILRFCNWRQRLVSRLPGWRPDHPRHAVLPEHRKAAQPRIRLYHPVLHLVRAGHRRLRDLLEGSGVAQALTVRLCACRGEAGARWPGDQHFVRGPSRQRHRSTRHERPIVQPAEPLLRRDPLRPRHPGRLASQLGHEHPPPGATPAEDRSRADVGEATTGSVGTVALQLWLGDGQLGYSFCLHMMMPFSIACFWANILSIAEFFAVVLRCPSAGQSPLLSYYTPTAQSYIHPRTHPLGTIRLHRGEKVGRNVHLDDGHARGMWGLEEQVGLAAGSPLDLDRSTGRLQGVAELASERARARLSVPWSRGGETADMGDRRELDGLGTIRLHRGEKVGRNVHLDDGHARGMWGLEEQVGLAAGSPLDLDRSTGRLQGVAELASERARARLSVPWSRGGETADMGDRRELDGRPGVFFLPDIPGRGGGSLSLADHTCCFDSSSWRRPCRDGAGDSAESDD